MPDLTIAGETFRCRPKLPAAATMRLAKSQKGDEVSQLAGFLDFVVALLADDEKPRFDTFLDTCDAEFDEWNEAVGTLLEVYADRPTLRPSLSQDGPTTIGGPSSPDSSSQDTGRVVNLSQRAG